VKHLKVLIALIFIFYFFIVSGAWAFESTSTTFQIRASSIESISGGSSSTNFKNQSAGGQISTGISSNLNKIYSGILYWLFPSIAGPVCGNNIIESGEECDDGNTANGDGCSSTCQTEEEEVPPTGGGGGVTFVTPPEIPPTLPVTKPGIADLNRDGEIGLEDLSILIYFMSRPAPNPADLNKDSKIDIKDFSVLLSQWNERAPIFAFEKPEIIAGLQKIEEKGWIIEEKGWIREQQAAATGWAITAEEKGPALIAQERARGMGSKLLKSFTQFVSDIYKKVWRFFISFFR
jgi:cysteine-rich repeat protein